MRCLIVAPRTVNAVGEYYEFPLGLAYISSALKAKGHHVECLNLNQINGAVKKLVAEAIKRFDAEAVFTGGLSIHYRQIAEVLHAAKSISGVISVLGGGIVSSNPNLVFDALKPDFAVLFEGEQTCVELAQALDDRLTPSTVNGLMYPENGKIVQTEPRKAIADLDSIAWPDYEGLGADLYLQNQMTCDSRFFYMFDEPRALPMISSRSCPFNCTFCFHPLGNRYRRRSIEGFFNELEFLQRRFKLNMVLVYDELFGANFAWLRSFCERMEKTGLKWMTQVRVDSKLSDEKLTMLKKSGLVCLGFGLESASQKVLNSMGKCISVAQMENALSLTWNHKIGIQGNFIFGDVAETNETVKETLDWYKQHRNYQIVLTPIYVYPGTRLYEVAREKGLIGDELAFHQLKYPLVNVSQLSSSEYSQLLGELERLNVETRNMFKARVLSSKKIKHSTSGTVYDLLVECPICHAENHLSRFNYDSLATLDYMGVLLACRTCNRRFTVFVPSLLQKVFKHLPFSLYATACKAKRKIYQKIEGYKN